MSVKYVKCMPQDLRTWDIILLVNTAWEYSFAQVGKNRNAIADRGWNPLNRALPANSDILATMTDKERASEAASFNIILPKVDVTLNVANESPTCDPKYLVRNEAQPNLNFNSGRGQFCIDCLVQHNDLMKARHRINDEQKDGRSVREKLENATKATV